MSHVDHDPYSNAPRECFLALQHLKIFKPFFALILNRTSVLRTLPCTQEVSLLGFGYPLEEFYLV